MEAKTLAQEFFQLFCQGNLIGLEKLLCSDLKFKGPFLQVECRDDYLAALREGVIEPCSYKVMGEFQSGEEAGLFLRFEKGEASRPMAMYCRARGEQIAEIRLIFDPGKFS